MVAWYWLIVTFVVGVIITLGYSIIRSGKDFYDGEF
jgi:uncharacterized membrane-anchored protein YhcB (DUF1043 family)